LDGEKLDKLINALEKLHDKDRMVGVIRHVKELKERLQGIWRLWRPGRMEVEVRVSDISVKNDTPEKREEK
jgi:DNA repair exonuclease SbcCD ATPase subunit